VACVCVRAYLFMHDVLGCVLSVRLTVRTAECGSASRYGGQGETARGLCTLITHSARMQALLSPRGGSGVRDRVLLDVCTHTDSVLYPCARTRHTAHTRAHMLRCCCHHVVAAVPS
jgi:hypothetical protein